MVVSLLVAADGQADRPGRKCQHLLYVVIGDPIRQVDQMHRLVGEARRCVGVFWRAQG